MHVKSGAMGQCSGAVEECSGAVEECSGAVGKCSGAWGGRGAVHWGSQTGQWGKLSMLCPTQRSRSNGLLWPNSALPASERSYVFLLPGLCVCGCFVRRVLGAIFFCIPVSQKGHHN